MKDGYMSVKLCVHRSLLTSRKKEKENLKLETENAAQIEKKYGFKENKLTTFFYNYPPICKGDFIGK